MTNLVILTYTYCILDVSKCKRLQKQVFILGNPITGEQLTIIHRWFRIRVPWNFNICQLKAEPSRVHTLSSIVKLLSGPIMAWTQKEPPGRWAIRSQRVCWFRTKVTTCGTTPLTCWVVWKVAAFCSTLQTSVHAILTGSERFHG